MTERELFLSAIEIDDEEARLAHLKAACAGDESLLSRVTALLASLKTDQQFLQVPAIEQLGEDSSVEQLATIFMEAGSTLSEAPVGDETITGDVEGPGYIAAPRSQVAVPIAHLRPSTSPSSHSHSPSPSLGRLGHYELQEVLGRGAFGTVFRALDEKLQRVVAIKVIAPELAVSARARERFLGEARAAAAVRHENVVSVYAVEESPIPYLVMEYVPGQTLQNRLDERGPLPLAEVLSLGTQIAEGLAAAHARGLVHRDIKPGNILLEAAPRERAKITDFGLARAADDASLTHGGTIAGTPMFMAPEQALGGKIDQRADLFSFGSVLYLMATGQHPFHAPSSLGVLKKLLEDKPRPIADLAPETPDWLRTLIARLHSRNPDERFQTADEVASLLVHYRDEFRQNGATQQLSRISPVVTQPSVTHPTRWRGRTRAAVLFLLLTLIGLGMAEASGLTNLQGIVIHLFSREGTLVVEVDDPGVSVTLDDENLVIKGAGLREIRIDAGRHLLQAKKDGKVVRQEVVSIEKDGRKIVNISTEPSSPPSSAPERVSSDSEWEKSVAGLPASEQVAAVVERLKKLNRQFDGSLKPSIEDGVVRGLDLCTHYVSDISPLSAFRELKRLNLHGDLDGNLGLQGELVDLSPLRGLRLTTLNCICSPINDLSPLQGMPLAWINVERTEVTDLAPLQGMPLEGVNFYMCRVGDLSPLKGMRLKFLMAIGSVVSDLSPTSGMPLEEVFLTLSHVTDLEPLRGAPLKVLWCNNTRISSLAPLQGMRLQQLGCEDNDITDLSPLAGMPLTSLTCHNSKITDYSPLAHLPLRRLMIDFDTKRDAEILRGIATLEEINRMPATEFWKTVAEKN